MNLIEALKKYDKVTCDELIEDNCSYDGYICINNENTVDQVVCINNNPYNGVLDARYFFSESYREYTSNTEGHNNNDDAPIRPGSVKLTRSGIMYYVV